MIELSIPLPPISWKAPKFSNNRVYDPIGHEKNAARFYLREQYKAEQISEYVILIFKFIFQVPKSYSKKKRALALEGKIIPTRSDTTNLQKFYEDCLKGIVIVDDRNVAKIFSEKLYGEKDLIEIKVFTYQEFINGTNRGGS